MPSCRRPTLSRTLGALVLLAVFAFAGAGCGPVRQAAPVVDDAARYSDDLLQAVGDLLGTTKDDAVRYLDDLAAKGKPLVEMEAGVVAWSAQVGAMADDLATRWFSVPDERAMARAFVVGTTCDAFAAQRKRLIGTLTTDDIVFIVRSNLESSPDPAILGVAGFIDSLAAEIRDALGRGDLTTAFPGIAQLSVCQALG